LERHEDRQPAANLNSTPPEEPVAAEPPPEPTIGQWLAQNGPILAIILAGLTFLYIKFDLDGLLSIGKAALGLGFVIFFHELGHFLVAKWCDVHVQVFSIGFGPALPGCKFTRGETTYKLALIPLGGYVQMVGQVDGDEASDGSDDDPRSYRNKSVWQRMAIISAGVTMNAILAIICFVVVFMWPGKDRKAAIVAMEGSGGAAFKAGIPTGAEITQIDNIRHPYFEDLLAEVMATTDGEKVTLHYRVPPSTRDIAMEIEPRLSGGKQRRPMLGIAPPNRLVLLPRRFAGKALKRPAWPGTAADLAEPAFDYGDRIIATTDPEDSSKVTELPLDPRKPGSNQRDYFVFARRLHQLAGKEITIRVQRTEHGKDRTVDIKVPAAFHRIVGARMLMGQITVVQDNSPGASTDPNRHVQARHSANNQELEGDVIEKVEVNEPFGTTTFGSDDQGPAVTFGSDDLPARARLAATLFLPGLAQPWAWHQALNAQLTLDPVRLPDQLRQWAGRLTRAGVPEKQWLVTLHLRRHNVPGNPRTTEQYRSVVVQLPWRKAWTYQDVQPFDQSSPLAIPELGLAYQIKTTVAGVSPRLAAAGDNSLQPGDVIEKVQVWTVDKNGEAEADSRVNLGADQWACTFERLQAPVRVEKVVFSVKRNKETREVTVNLEQDPSWPLAERGLVLDFDLRRQKADGVFEAIGMGLKDTKTTMLQVYQNLRGMVTGRISVDNLGGPLTIAHVAYRIAGVDFWEFVFFLGLISINLAVINFLPIPVLDGGHMVFLLYEKIRGKPASEQVRVGATYAGLLLLASLMIFVIYLDISRMVRGG
jgi:regulator of sigma E protease